MFSCFFSFCSLLCSLAFKIPTPEREAQRGYARRIELELHDVLLNILHERSQVVSSLRLWGGVFLLCEWLLTCVSTKDVVVSAVLEHWTKACRAKYAVIPVPHGTWRSPNPARQPELVETGLAPLLVQLLRA
jgi:hypothetical protein